MCTSIHRLCTCVFLNHKPVAEMIMLQSYANAAARTDASLIKFPPVALTHQATSANDAAQQTGNSSLPEPDPGSTKKRKKLGSDVASELSEASQNKQPKVEGTSAAAAAAAVSSAALLDDDIDWTATADKSDQSDLQLASSADDAVQQAGRSQPSADEPDTVPAHSQHVDTAGESKCLQQQQAAFAAHEAPSSTGDKGDKHVQQAVGEYVKALLDPFYKAGIVNREVSYQTKLALHVLCWCRSACNIQHMYCQHTQSQLHSIKLPQDTEARRQPAILLQPIHS